MYVIFHISPGLLLLEFNNTLLYQNEGVGDTCKNINIPLPFYWSSITPYLPSVKTIKILMLIRKFSHMQNLFEGFVFASYGCSKQSVSCLLTLNWSEHFIWYGCFQICSGNNNISLLLYACEVIHLINKGVTSSYVQE